MSVEALSVVLHHSRARGTAKLVLLGVANHQGDGGAWPAVDTLAKYANVTPRNVQKALDTLCGMGELQRFVQGGGLADWDDYTRPNRYVVLVACPPWCDRTMQHRDTRRRSGRQVALPVEKPGVGIDTRSPKQGDPLSESTPGPLSESTPKPHSEPGDDQVSASTTDRARRSARRCEAGCTLADPQHAGVCDTRPAAPPPVDDLDAVRARLRADAALVAAREIGALP